MFEITALNPNKGWSPSGEMVPGNLTFAGMEIYR